RPPTEAAPRRSVERVCSGRAPTPEMGQGTCSEIAAGAPLAQGADAVIMVEDPGRPEGDHVPIYAGARAGQNIGRKGADIAPGDLVVRRGDLLNPSRIGALAAIGCAAVDVFAQPIVAVLSTGNEVIEPGHALGGAQIFDV